MELDISSIDFRESLDLGCIRLGTASIRATMFVNGKKVDIDPLSDDPAILSGGSEAGEFIKRRMRDPARAARMSAARERLGTSLERTYQGKSGLAYLRLKAGLSQAEVAMHMGTQQPSIARWERSPKIMGFENLQAYAKALGLKTADVCTAIENSQTDTVETNEHQTA